MMRIFTVKKINELTRECGADKKWLKTKWVAVDDKFTMEISKMLILISAFTKEDTEGEVQLEQWQEYFKPITEKQSKEN